MQSLYGQPPLSRGATARATRLMERVLSANGVTRARDLPEEARVRLYCQLSLCFEREREAHWARQMRANPFEQAWRRFTEWLSRQPG